MWAERGTGRLPITEAGAKPNKPADNYNHSLASAAIAISVFLFDFINKFCITSSTFIFEYFAELFLFILDFMAHN